MRIDFYAKTIYGALIDLHEREGEIRGQQADDTAMDVTNNEIGIQIGMGARTFDDVMSAARKVISGSATDGLGAWKPEYDPTSTMAPHAAQWLPEKRWALNPTEDAPPRSRVRFPPLPPSRLETWETNWYSNPKLPDGPDWEGSYVPDGYVYPFGEVQHATGQDDPAMLRARDAYQFLVRRPGLLWLKDRL